MHTYIHTHTHIHTYTHTYTYYCIIIITIIIIIINIRYGALSPRQQREDAVMPHRPAQILKSTPCRMYSLSIECVLYTLIITRPLVDFTSLGTFSSKCPLLCFCIVKITYNNKNNNNNTERWSRRVGGHAAAAGEDCGAGRERVRDDEAG